MYIVGFIDNIYNLFSDYQKRLERHDIELIGIEAGKTKQEVVDWILKYHIKCLMVDFELQPHFSFAGTELIVYINSILPDLPCMIITNYTEQSTDENLVVENMIEGREILDNDDITPLVRKLKQAVEVYNNRMIQRLAEFEALTNKKNSGNIDAFEEERYEYLYGILKAYEEIDELPAEMLKPEMEEKIDSLIDKLERLLHKNQ